MVELWENSEDYERLANATRKTMRYINDEQIKSFADALNETNEKILNLTFEGVKKHHEKKFEQIIKKQKIYVASAFAGGVLIGALAVWVAFWARLFAMFARREFILLGFCLGKFDLLIARLLAAWA